MKLLAITVPCYNSQEYMRHCVETLLTGDHDGYSIRHRFIIFLTMGVLYSIILILLGWAQETIITPGKRQKTRLNTCIEDFLVNFKTSIFTVPDCNTCNNLCILCCS
jgi:hypothetical protein